MQRYAAFLRGINLGRRRVKMDVLKAAFEDLGLTGVATYIASGNVIFDHAGARPSTLEARIEAHLEPALGFATATFVRSLDELEPFVGLEHVKAARADGFNVHVIFLRPGVGEDVVSRLGALEGPDDRFHVSGREVLWLRRGRMTDSPFRDRDLHRALGGVLTTMRNLSTVEQIVAKFR